VSTINTINDKIDQTVRIYDEFYNYSEDVPAAEYDLVNSYFKSVFDTPEQADAFTVSIFRVAQESGDSALTIVQQLQGTSGPQLTISLCYYLNSVRSRATLLGVLQPAAPNFWTARNVRQ
jgi:hypothetical protein